MGIDRTIDITSDQRKTLLSLLERYLPNTAAWVYGSRVKWTSRPQSDLDLVVFATPDQQRRVSELREAFEESNLPFRVDLFVWDDVPEQFHKQIEAEHVVLAEREERGAADGWVRRKIGALGRVVTGKTPSTAERSNFDGPYPFITIPDLDGRVLINNTVRTLSDKGAAVLRTCLLPPGAVLMSCIATVGRCGVTTRPSFTNQQINSVIPGGGIDSRFLYYVFTQLGHKLESSGGGGSVYTNVSKSRFSDIEILIPVDLTEQRAIAHILGTLDDRIELNRRMNETLEAMARALFKSWFVDFDPVRAKAALKRRAGAGNEWTLERARAYLDNMDEEVAALFPDSFVDSELGEIPEGWGVGTVSQLAERIKNGGTPKRSEPTYWECGEIPWLTSGEVRQSFILGTQNFISEEGLEKSSAKMVPARSILVALYGTTAGQVSMNYQPLSTNQAVSAVIPSTGNRYFCLISLKLEVSELENRAVGSAQQNISKKIVEDTIVLLPHIKLRSAYDALVEPLFDRNFHNLDENQTLATLRDMLLPKLVSGEIRLRDVERFAEVAQ